MPIEEIAKIKLECLKMADKWRNGSQEETLKMATAFASFVFSLKILQDDLQPRVVER